MAAMLTIQYDREGDILHIEKCLPYPEQETDEIAEEVFARLNPKTGDIENLEVLFFSARLEGSVPLELSVTADLRKTS